MQKESQEQKNLSSFRCVEDNIAFVMLGEVLRARSHELVQQLKADKPDLTALRRLAVHMYTSTDNLIQDAGLVSRKDASHELYKIDSTEPASVQSIVDLCFVAAKHRLSELNIALESNSKIHTDLFVSGNPWELSYALLFALLHCGRSLCLCNDSSRLSHLTADNSATNVIRLEVHCEADFADIIISCHAPLVPDIMNTAGAFPFQSTLSQPEWVCLQRLVAKNNAHLQSQLSAQPHYGLINIVFRLPTFQPGHEEPLDFFTSNVSLRPEGSES